ncbi:MAG TPA: hypothetical protein PK453_28230, partial [Leptospiraceae bacterium]|nr:hypothetical protein [Leptospiraceae bacterium]
MKSILTALLVSVSVSIYSHSSQEAFFSFKEKNRSHLIGKYLYVYQDSTNSLKIEDISSPFY